ncbi:MAG: mechanosensitive ion channel domain-containing protein [Chthoniobacterales bacterium]
MARAILAASQNPLGPSLEVFGIRFVGVNPENGQKLLLTLAAIAVFLLARWILRGLARLVVPRDKAWLSFWIGQGITLATALLLLLTILSIWFDDPTRLATALGLVTAGLAFALQKVVTAFAGYMVILRGNTLSVGDRIVMGGVRGDVIALGFLQTTIMEMGQPASVQNADPAVWVRAGSTPAGWSRSPMARFLKSRSLTTRATFPISGKKS